MFVFIVSVPAIEVRTIPWKNSANDRKILDNFEGQRQSPVLRQFGNIVFLSLITFGIADAARCSKLHPKMRETLLFQCGGLLQFFYNPFTLA
jgi:hypothetical protein